MKAGNSLCVVLVFVFGLCINDVSGFAASKPELPLTRWRVNINNFQPNDTILAHCKSKDDDLGLHVIEIGKTYEWEFKENFSRTTLFWCNFRNKVAHASFQVFWAEKGSWLSSRCTNSNCIWAAKNDGFYLYNGSKMQFELIHPWELGTSN